MHELTKQAILKIQKKTKRSLTIDDFDLMAELDNLAQAVKGTSPIERRLLRSPYELCGVFFYPLTVAKSLWFEEKVAEWGVIGTEQDALLFWLLSLPLNSNVLDEYAGYKNVAKAVKKLNRRLHCTNTELTEIYEKCVGVTSGGQSESKTDYGGLIATLLKEYGGKPDEWIYDTPIDVISAMFSSMVERVEAENKSASGNGKAVAPVATPRIIALAKFREKANEIEALWSQDNG